MPSVTAGVLLKRRDITSGPASAISTHPVAQKSTVRFKQKIKNDYSTFKRLKNGFIGSFFNCQYVAALIFVL